MAKITFGWIRQVEVVSMLNTSRPRPKIIDLALYGLASYIPGLLSLAGIYLFVRLLPPDEFGYFSLWSAVVLMISTVAAQWIRHSILRYWKEYDQKDERARFCSTILSLTSATCAGLCLLAVIGYPIADRFLPSEYMRLYLSGILTTLFLIIANI